MRSGWKARRMQPVVSTLTSNDWGRSVLSERHVTAAPVFAPCARRRVYHAFVRDTTRSLFAGGSASATTADWPSYSSYATQLKCNSSAMHLALQMISISNILGGRAVMGLQHIPEGQFVRAALPACLAYYIAGTALALPFLFAG